MKISDQDIIRTARQLRDEENEQLQVPELSINKSSNSKSSNSKLKYFLPAAAIIGFVLGYLTPRTDSSEGSPLTALVDTVYIKVHELKEDTLPRPEELVNPKTETPVVVNSEAAGKYILGIADRFILEGAKNIDLLSRKTSVD